MRTVMRTMRTMRTTMGIPSRITTETKRERKEGKTYHVVIDIMGRVSLLK